MRYKETCAVDYIILCHGVFGALVNGKNRYISISTFFKVWGNQSSKMGKIKILSGDLNSGTLTEG